MNNQMEAFLNSARISHNGVAGGFEEKFSVTKIGEGSHRHVYEMEDGKVLKVCEPSAEWANKNEIGAWYMGEKYEQKIPEQAMDMLTPVLDYGGDGKWLVMKKADVNHPDLLGYTDGQLKERFIKKMGESGWGIEDPHRDNIAMLNGEMVTVDYTYLSPIDEMLPKPRGRWKSSLGEI